MVKGIITTRDVLAHFPLICREFGLKVAGRCIWAIVSRRKTTFLALIA